MLVAERHLVVVTTKVLVALAMEAAGQGLPALVMAMVWVMTVQGSAALVRMSVIEGWAAGWISALAKAQDLAVWVVTLLVQDWMALALVKVRGLAEWVRVTSEGMAWARVARLKAARVVVVLVKMAWAKVAAVMPVMEEGDSAGVIGHSSKPVCLAAVGL